MDNLSPIKQEFVRIIKELKKQHGISYTEMHRQTGIKHDLFKKASSGKSFAVTGEIINQIKQTFSKELSAYAQNQDLETGFVQEAMAHLGSISSSRFIYELDEGQPIYLKNEKIDGGWQMVLDSPLQAYLKASIGFDLQKKLLQSHIITIGQQALWIGENNLRAMDIGLFVKEQFSLQGKQSCPEVIIEIDSKAQLDGMGSAISYFQKKNAQFKALGVQKVIWIFTESKTVWSITSENGQPNIKDWKSDIQVLENVSFNIQSLLDEFVVG